MKFKQFLCWTLMMCSFFTLAIESDINQYRLGSGDVIKITVFGQEDLSLETRLSHMGVINYPFLGDLTAVGLTASELESRIYTGLKGDYLVEPSISVTILEYRPFFIDGEVKKPGGYPYQPSLTINKAAALAGGYTERAARNKIVVVRDLAGKQTTFTASVTDIVQPGDIITVQQSFF